MFKGEFGERGYDELTFTYNEQGLRTKKSRMFVDETTGDICRTETKYTLHGKNVVHMTQGSNELHFFYDASNKPAVVVYNGTPYSYVKNLQGDIVAILDSNGNVVVQYKYDAWGRQIDCTFEAGNNEAEALSTLNPFRYRGYVFDEETGLYYLRSRYYAPAWRRFINADALAKGNLFAYCSNNPINFHDPDGYEQITSVDDLYRLIAEQAVLEGGVPASEFLSRSNEVMNVGKPYKNTMEPERGFVCSGYFLYYFRIYKRLWFVLCF